MNITSELVISVLALACSLCAVWQTKKQHQSSMLPHLELPFSKDRLPNGVVFTLTLKNTGLGPAIISDRWYSVADRRYESQSVDPLEEIAAKVLDGRAKYQVRRHGLPGVGSILPARDEFCIYEVFIAGVTAETEADVIKLADGIEFEGCYRSICGDTFSFSTKGQRVQTPPSLKRPS